MNNFAFELFFDGPPPFVFDASKPVWEALLHLDDAFKNREGKIHPDAEISPLAELINRELITIESGARIEGASRIEGPAFIGKGAVVAHGASVRAGTWLMENTRVGHCSEVKRSLLFPGAKAAHFNYVGDSLLGKNVNLGAGAILCNQRLNKRPIRIAGIETHMPKLGACIGDGASLGSGVICNPGVLIERGAICLPKLVITGLFTASSCPL